MRLGFCPLTYSTLTPEKGEIIHFYAVNRWDEEDEFNEWGKPSVALTAEAERILGVTNTHLDGCRSSCIVLEEFLAFAECADFALGFAGSINGGQIAKIF